ncbi:LysR family transcriptional regulator [Neobacillus sp. PS2-9]|uniref:LysR family transcriptional regulator n=1 Tax=Neobacillus sp. PS2-9 TaxID=3070676 RepID=UPI0027E00EBA|nr:LysR family transcriptional regulator [Neobacillus sp. PS2-9]WML56713.1 LysR family transcriptional regulator [Neobacillus sp. PS2-9]
MEIRQLQTFKTVVDLNSFTKAAQTLQYSQASITSHIQQLEEEIGLPLFDRLGKHIQLTIVGEELYHYAVELLAVYSKIQHISTNDRTLKGEIRIGAAESITVYKLGKVLSQYKKLYPEVSFSLINDDCLPLRERLYSGEIDIAITLEPKVNDPNLITQVWAEESLVFVGENNHSIKAMEEATGECFIFSPKSCALRKFFEGYLIRNGISTHNHLEFNSMEAMKQCVVSGLGISLMPYISVETLLREEKMKAIESASENPVFYAQISYHKNKWLSKAHRKFIKMVLGER